MCRSIQKRNRLEHQRLNKVVYVSYNQKMENRFAKIREHSSKGKKSNPLVLEEFQWENEWVDEESDSGNLWTAVDEALGATEGLWGQNVPRATVGLVRGPLLLLSLIQGPMFELGSVQGMLKMLEKKMVVIMMMKMVVII
jgi:hypothetical protein